MIFNEIYGLYYKTAAKIIRAAQEGNLSEQRLKKIVDENAFKESFLEIIPKLKNENWKIITSDLKTPIKNTPSIPLTQLELSWLKAISLDKRFKLFDLNTDFLDGVEPLFTPANYIIYDKYSDGDPYDDENYIKNFRLILKAVNENKRVALEYHSNKNTCRLITCQPYELEFSEKDDKFRVHINSLSNIYTLNVAGIVKCEILSDDNPLTSPKRYSSDNYFIAELTNYRNALERFLLHFSHFKKETEKIDEKTYRIKVYYDKTDETELVIRVLSFGQFVRVIEPTEFVGLIKERLIKQKSCGL